MKINVQSVNFNILPELVDYTEKKIDKLDQYYDKIIAAHVFFKVENTSDKNNKIAEIKLEVPGDDIMVKKSGQSFEECIDLSFDTLKKLIIRKKEKIASR